MCPINCSLSGGGLGTFQGDTGQSSIGHVIVLQIVKTSSIGIEMILRSIPFNFRAFSLEI